MMPIIVVLQMDSLLRGLVDLYKKTRSTDIHHSVQLQVPEEAEKVIKLNTGYNRLKEIHINLLHRWLIGGRTIFGKSL